jgi:hypothetical protein
MAGPEKRPFIVNSAPKKGGTADGETSRGAVGGHSPVTPLPPVDNGSKPFKNIK